MNIFRLLGDFSHLGAIIILLLKIWKTRSCAGRNLCFFVLFTLIDFIKLGVSGKSVLLYAIVFTCRYLDLFTHIISLYNSVMKIIYLVSTFFTLYLIYRKFRATYDRNHDTFRIEFLILPSAVLALIWNFEFSVLEVCFSQVFINSFLIKSFRFFGHFQFILNQLLYFLNYLWLAKQVKLKQ
jgi:ER lumen protein retaining receptor